jgi:hypothetical protein
LTSIPPAGGNRQRFGRSGSIRGEAAARGISEYQVRRERAASGSGARVSRIPWQELDPFQVNSIRTTIPRNRWRAAVEAAIDNSEHWTSTGDKADANDYRGHFLDSTRYDEEDEEGWVEEHGELVVKSLYWYHQKMENRRRL